MSHDTFASWAAAEVARRVETDPGEFFNASSIPSRLTSYASHESGNVWPLADGVITAETDRGKFLVALEMKRVNEGVHGVLTALGQSLSYLDKGYDGAVVALPREYSTLSDPGGFVDRILDQSSPTATVGIYCYEHPDQNLPSPFENRLDMVRSVGIGVGKPNDRVPAATATQWAHVREGESSPDFFYRYLKSANAVSMDESEIAASLPQGLIDAATRVWPNRGPLHSLAYTSGAASMHDATWRRFWFENVLTRAVAEVWRGGDGRPYEVVREPTSLLQWNGERSEFFSKRKDSVKFKIVQRMNAGELTEDQAWEAFAHNVRDRAHSLREDIDSGLEAIGFVSRDGRVTESGYRFMSAADRAGGNATSGTPLALFTEAFLGPGGYGAFVHYIHRLSEDRFRVDPMAFTTVASRGANTKYGFDQDAYRNWLEGRLANDLKVMNKSSLRGGKSRRPLQAELTLLRKLGVIAGFRTGVGVEIEWERLNDVVYGLTDPR